MNKKGQVMDIFEFKIALVIVLVLILISIVLFDIVLFGKDKTPIFGDWYIDNLQKRTLYQDLLIDKIKNNNFGDLIVKGEKVNGLLILHPNNFDNPEKVKIYYPIYVGKEDIGSEKIYDTFENELTYTIIPTFDGKYIIGVVLVNGQER